MPRRVIRVRVVRRRRYAAPRRSLAIRKVLSNKIHQFTRSQYYSGAVSGSTSFDTFGGIYFRLQDMPNVSEFTNLFDMYRIDKVTIKFMPRANSAEAGTNQGLVKLFTVIDKDDITTPTSIAELLQYETCKVTPMSRVVTRTFKPLFAREAFQGGVTSAYTPGSGWIDCSNPLVQHYGIKWGMQQLPAGAQTCDLHIKYHLSFKNVV